MKTAILFLASLVTITSYAQTNQVKETTALNLSSSPKVKNEVQVWNLEINEPAITKTTPVAKKIKLSEFPTQNNATIFVSSNVGCQVEIYTQEGVHVKNISSHCDEIINLTGLSNGYYIIKIKDNLGGKEIRKVLLG